MGTASSCRVHDFNTSCITFILINDTDLSHYLLCSAYSANSVPNTGRPEMEMYHDEPARCQPGCLIATPGMKGSDHL